MKTADKPTKTLWILIDKYGQLLRSLIKCFTLAGHTTQVLLVTV